MVVVLVTLRSYRKMVDNGKRDEEFFISETNKTKAWVLKQESLLFMYVAPASTDRRLISL